MLKLKFFDKTADGRDVWSIVLENSVGEYAELINYGATLKSLFVKDAEGKLRDVVLGYDDMAGYEKNDSYFGAIIGRCANRLTGPSFTLGDREYKLNDNTGSGVALHGGIIGFDKKIWDIDFPEANAAVFEALKCGGEIMAAGNSITLTLFSPDGDEGYPGNLTLKVTYTFTDAADLEIKYDAECDCDTVLNVTNHAYFNLDGQDCGHNCLDTYVKIYSDMITPLGNNFAPTGEFMDVAGTPYDFNEFKKIGQDVGADHPQLIIGSGYDQNFVIRRPEDEAAEFTQFSKPVLASECYSKESGILMKTYTDLPGIQFYIGNFIKPQLGKQWAMYGHRSGFCFETQMFPDGINIPAFVSPVLRSGDRFTSKTVYAFGTMQT